jgi:hypothetical protein
VYLAMQEFVSVFDFGRFEKKHSGCFSHCGVFTRPGSCASIAIAAAVLLTFRSPRILSFKCVQGDPKAAYSSSGRHATWSRGISRHH